MDRNNKAQKIKNNATNVSDNIIIGVQYRHPTRNDESYLKYLNNTLHKIQKEKKKVLITGDFNCNLLKYNFKNEINEFLGIMLKNLFLPHITGPTRVCKQKPSLIDNIFLNDAEVPCISGNLTSKISDHLPSFII